MKKLFLTSGIIACMACPAFADITTGTDGNIGNTGSGLVYPKGQNATATAEDLNGATIANACVHDVLDAYSGSVTLKAQWKPAYAIISLVSNLDTNALTTNGNGVPASPEQIYAAGGSLWKSIVNDNLTTELGEGDTPFNQGTPLGDYVTYVLNLNDGTGSTTATQDTTETASVTPARRPLVGFYDTNDTQMIDEDGLLTADGAAATTAQTWTASWGAANATVGEDPTRDGYTFNGWSSSSAGTNPVATANLPAISSNTPIYASWSANTYNITYSCADGNGGQGTPATGHRTAEFDSPYTWLGNSDADNCGRLGHHFTGWDCTSGNTTITASVSQELDTNNNNAPISGSYVGNEITVAGSPWADLANGATIACTAHYEPNTIGIAYDGDGADNWTAPVNSTENACSYGTGITLPTAPSKVGFDFIGWEVVNPTQDNNLYNGPTE